MYDMSIVNIDNDNVMNEMNYKNMIWYSSVEIKI